MKTFENVSQFGGRYVTIGSLFHLAVFFASCTHAVCAAPPREVTVEDYFSVTNINEAVISPAGDRIAYVDARWPAAAGDRQSDLWIAYADARPAKRLTHDGAGYRQVSWSVDGSYLYFAGERSVGGPSPPFNEQTQVWRLSVDGSALVPITRETDGINLFALSSDGAAIFYTTSSSDFAGDWAPLRNEFSDIKYGAVETPTTTIWRIDLSSWRTSKIYEFEGYVDDLAVAPDDRRMALITAPNDETSTLEGQTQVTILEIASATTSNLPDNSWRQQAPSPYGRLYSPKWSSDSKALAFFVGFDGYPSEILIADWTAESAPQIKRVKRPSEVSVLGGVDSGAQLAWLGTSHDLCFLGENRARIRAYVVRDVTSPAQASDALTPGDVVVEFFSLNATGDRLAAVASGPTFMPDVYLFENGQGTPLTEVNSHTRDWKLPEVSVVSWQAADGASVEGVLELPPGHTGKLPVIVNLHGGPTASWLYRMYYGYFGSVMYASQGYAFFSPNYRGSTGYGDQFLTQLIGHENGIEVEDILNGIDHLIEQGIVDPDKIGIAGWSNGGYLTNCLITRKGFAAASSGAGIVDLVQHWGTSDEPALARVFAQGTVFEQPELYHRFSPVWQLDSVSTPTIIHVCTGDHRCPPGNSQMLYRALGQTLGKTAELLVYPDGGHGLSNRRSRKAKLAWDLAWFDHYLRGKAMPGEEK